jgi:ferrous iron transport protein A
VRPYIASGSILTRDKNNAYTGGSTMINGEIPLNQLPIGKKASVSRLLSDGATRKRLLDLGIIDGTEIQPLYRSPSGNPVAYWIRGAVIALRFDVSDRIMVTVSS